MANESMRLLLKAVFDDRAGNVRARIMALAGLLLLVNVFAWLWAAVAFHAYPLLLGTSLLAYSFGLRHAVDADHIAAIDNVTRKLMQEGKRPVAVGLMFSLGHSTIVFFGSAGLAFMAFTFQRHLHAVKEFGGVVGTAISVFFLFAIAMVNVILLRSVWQTFARVRRGEPYVDEDLNLLLANRGLLARVFRPMFALIQRSWHMYPLGILFGLGFDTATEISVLGISAGEASKGLSLWSVLVFPALFAAGMSLIDSLDNVMMLGAYGWAFVKPVRKLYYNITITLVSVIVALAVGGIEALGLLAGHFHWRGVFWDGIARLNDHFGMLGYVIIALFAFSWVLSVAIYKWRDFDSLELNA